MDKIRPAVQPLLAPPSVAPQPNRRSFPSLVASGFLLSVSTALSIYIHSSFLKTLVPEEMVGYLFTLASALTFFVIYNYWRLVSRYGNHETLLAVVGLQMLSAIVLACNISPVTSIVAFVVFMILSTVSIINYDLWMEPMTRNVETGRIRGVFWTATNLGFLISPFMTGLLAERYGFGPAYLASAGVLIPAWVIIFISRNHRAPKTLYNPHQSTRAMLLRIVRSPNLRGIFAISTLLFVFYSLMVVYSPLFLIRAGLDWKEIGTIFTIMLLPFVLIEYPAGWLADNYIGETEMLTLGFSLVGISTLLMLKADRFSEFALTLFFSRVGASLVEIMRESYFYKQVDAEDLDLIEAFRNTVTIAYTFAPLFASFALLFGVTIKAVLATLGVVMLLATGIPVTMEDTK